MSDQLIMLFSADWFIPYWPRLGLRVDRSRATNFQLGCREIVKEFLSDATEYWHVTFSRERLNKTGTKASVLAKKCGIEDIVNNLIIESKGDVKNGSDSGRTYFALTKRLVNGEDDLPLDPGITGVVRATLSEFDDEPDFARICLASDSQWDRYLRSLTPTQPTFLADYLVARLLSRRAFRYLWIELKRSLKPEQLEQLITWYRSTAHSLLGEDIAPPE